MWDISVRCVFLFFVLALPQSLRGSFPQPAINLGPWQWKLTELFHFLKFIYLFLLRWVSVAAGRLSLAAAGRGSSWLQLMDFSSQWLLWLCSVGIGHPAYFISDKLPKDTWGSFRASGGRDDYQSGSSWRLAKMCFEYNFVMEKMLWMHS